MKGSLRVMKRDVIAAARQGTVTCGDPERTDRMRGVASGVRVIAVFNPAHRRHFIVEISRHKTNRTSLASAHNSENDVNKVRFGTMRLLVHSFQE